MAIDGFFIKNLINETSDSIINYRLEKVFLIKEDIISFSFYYRKDRNFLNIKLKPPFQSFYLSKNNNVNTEISCNFITNLKRNLEGYILKSITQHNSDRVVIFEFNGVDLLQGLQTKYLTLELMGRYNNLILTDSDNVIIDAFIKNMSTTSRSILPKLKYSYFPTDKLILSTLKNIDILDKDYLYKNYIGISPLLSNYLFENNIDIFNESIKATKQKNNNKFYWFDLFDINEDKEYYNSLSEMLEENINIGEVNNQKYSLFIDKEISSLKQKLGVLNKSLNESLDNLVLVDYGNYIYSSGINLNETHSDIKTYDGKIIKLDSSKNLLENAKHMFNLYGKAKRSIEHLELQISESINFLNTLTEYQYELDNNLVDYIYLDDVLKPFGFKVKQKKKKKQVTKNYLELSYLNNTYYIGRNSKENDFVTHTIGKHNDTWFHIKDLPGSHVVMKGEVSDDSLSFGAMLAQYYSKGKNDDFVNVNYTLIKNLKKIPKLPGSQVILTSYKTINIKQNIKLINDVLIANNLN